MTAATESKTQTMQETKAPAAITLISTVYSGPASRASTVARAGLASGATQASHSVFISAKLAMSAK